MKTCTVRILSALFLFIFILTGPACKNKEQVTAPQGKKIELTIESHKPGNTVRRPLPLVMHGRIKNYAELTGTGSNKGLFVYLIEQSTREKIWHIEPQVVIDDKGNWKGVTWLGNKITGNRSKYNVCVFASEKELKLKNGNHPVKDKPAATGESCLEINRKD